MAQKKNFKNPAMQFISTAEEEREAATDTAAEEAGEIAPAQSEKELTAEDPTELFRRAAQAAGVNIPSGYRLAPAFKSARIQILARPETKKAIQKEAAALGLSMNELINRILDEHVERQDRA